MVRFIIGERFRVAAWHITLRKWHSQCLDVLLPKMREGQRTLAVAAVMGAGKTMLSLRYLHSVLESHAARIGVVVVPTDNLRFQFCRDAKYARLRAYAVTSRPDQNVDPSERVSCIKGLDAPLPDDAHCIVITYAQLAIKENVDALAALCKEVATAWVFDEVHHTGDGFREDDDPLRWADGMLRAAEHAVSRLLTTATPNRTDGRRIPFLQYDGNDVPQFDYIYNYEKALQDGYVRPVEFVCVNGTMRWWEDEAGDVEATFTDKIDKKQQSRRLNTAIDPDHKWVLDNLTQAHACLRDIRHRGKHSDAGGLVVVRGKKEATRVATMLRTLGANGVVVVTYDDPNASHKIDAFRKSQDEWIVAVRMVSEGVDIKRLRVISYCTNITTDLLFLQIMGRALRMIDGITPQIAYMFIPPDPRIMKTVEIYRDIVMRALKEPGTGPGPGKQEHFWYGQSADGFEDGRIHDSDYIPQRYIDRARPVSHGSIEIETAVARALLALDSGHAQTQTETAEPEPAWDAEKNGIHDDIKSARRELTSIRIQSGRYPDRDEAAQSVNSDMFFRFGALDKIRHKPDVLKQYLDYMQILIKRERKSDAV